MRLLLDSCIWGPAMKELAEHGHDVEWVGDLPADPGDAAILERANLENRVLVTLDKDFGEFAIVRGLPHAGIVRLVGFSAKRQAAACLTAIERHSAELNASAIITVEPGRIRVRSPE